MKLAEVIVYGDAYRDSWQPRLRPESAVRKRENFAFL